MTFPTIEEGLCHRGKPKGVEFPINPLARRFTRRSEQATIPFEEIRREQVKLKTILINLSWTPRGEVAEPPSMAGGSRQELNRAGEKGPTRQRPWFRLPPKDCPWDPREGAVG